MKDRLFSGFKASELVAMLAKITAACGAINARASVRIDVSGSDQLITLRTKGVVVTVGHGTQPGDTLTTRVHHNRCYPQGRKLAERIASVLLVEVDSK